MIGDQDDDEATAMRPIRPNRAPTTHPLTVPAAFDIRRTRRPRAQASMPPPAMDAETVIARLEEAGHTLLSLPRAGQTRHHPLAEALGAFTALEIGRPQPLPPPASRIIRMDQALAWIPLIPKESLVVRRIVGCRCLVSPLTGRHLFSWRRLARLLGADHKVIQRWHETGVKLITTPLNRDAAVLQSWDRL